MVNYHILAYSDALLKEFRTTPTRQTVVTSLVVNAYGESAVLLRVKKSKKR